MQVNQSTPKKRRIAPLLILAVAVAGIVYWQQGKLADSPATVVEEREFTPEPYFPHLDTGVTLPVDVKINLLNSPAAAGDVAELELMLTSRLEDARVEAQFILPDDVVDLGGESAWSGQLALNETKRLRTSVQVNTEDSRAVQAKVTIHSGETTFTRGAAYNIDLGEKDYVEGKDIPVSGYDGGTELNVIIPKDKK